MRSVRLLNIWLNNEDKKKVEKKKEGEFYKTHWNYKTAKTERFNLKVFQVKIYTIVKEIVKCFN